MTEIQAAAALAGLRAQRDVNQGLGMPCSGYNRPVHVLKGPIGSAMSCGEASNTSGNPYSSPGYAQQCFPAGVSLAMQWPEQSQFNQHSMLQQYCSPVPGCGQDIVSISADKQVSTGAICNSAMPQASKQASRRSGADSLTRWQQQTSAPDTSSYDAAAAHPQRLQAQDAAGWRWDNPHQQQQQAISSDDVVRMLLHGEPCTTMATVQQQAVPLVEQPAPSHSTGGVQQAQSQHSNQAALAAGTTSTQHTNNMPAVADASTAGMANFAAAAAAFAAAMQQTGQLQQQSNSNGSMLSPAAFVHQAQQLLMQQQAVAQQQMLTSMLAAGGLAGAAGLLQPATATTTMQQQLPPAAAVAALAAAAAAGGGQGQASHGPAAQQRQQQQKSVHLSQQLPDAQSSGARADRSSAQQQRVQRLCSPEQMRAALGDRAFYSMRSLLMKQQETFMQQMFDLHRLNRVQNMAWSEVMMNHEHNHLTELYGQQALAALNNAKPQLLQGCAGRGSSAGIDAPQQQLQRDDGGAAAVAALPVHMALLANIPSAMKAAVSQPGSDSIKALNVLRYYARQGPGIIRPLAIKSTARSAGVGGKGRCSSSAGLMGLAAAAAAAASVGGPAVSGEETVQAAEVAPAVSARFAAQQQPSTDSSAAYRQQRQPPHRNTSTRSLQSHQQPVPASPAAAAAAVGSDVGNFHMLSKPPAYRTSQQQQQQVHQGDMPPPPPMLPELAAQHAAAAVAAAAAQQQQQQADSAGFQSVSGLNVFRPMPQIDPSFASKFLAGSQGGLSSSAVSAQPAFDPHSYWMKKHFGATSSISQQQGQDAVPTQQQQQHQTAAFDELVSAAAAAAGAHDSSWRQQLAADATDANAAVVAAATAGYVPGWGGTSSMSLPVEDQADVALDPAAAAAAPRPLHWWQDAEATFGEIGLLDPNAKGPLSLPGQSGGRSNRHGSGGGSSKRSGPQYLQQLPHKKRVKHAADGDYYYCSAAADEYGAATMCRTGGIGASGAATAPGGGCGAFKPLAALAGGGRERSRVRSSRFSSRQESIGSDNSASSIDNPNLIAAGGGDVGYEFAGAAAALCQPATRYGSSAGRGGSSYRGSNSRKQYHHGSSGGGYAARSGGGAVSSSSYQASAVCGHSTAKSAAGILLSLSGCHPSDV